MSLEGLGVLKEGARERVVGEEVSGGWGSEWKVKPLEIIAQGHVLT